MFIFQPIKFQPNEIETEKNRAIGQINDIKKKFAGNPERIKSELKKYMDKSDPANKKTKAEFTKDGKVSNWYYYYVNYGHPEYVKAYNEYIRSMTPVQEKKNNIPATTPEPAKKRDSQSAPPTPSNISPPQARADTGQNFQPPKAQQMQPQGAEEPKAPATPSTPRLTQKEIDEAKEKANRFPRIR
jgi:hypothetical protein